MSGLQIPGEIDLKGCLSRTVLDRLEKEVCDHFCIEDIRRSWQGDDRYIQARVSFSKQAYSEGYKQTEIAQFLGLADHSTISRYLRYEGKVRPLDPNIQSGKKRSNKSEVSWYNKMKQKIKNVL